MLAVKNFVKKGSDLSSAYFEFSSAASAYLCVLCAKQHFNAEIAEIRRGPQS